MKKTFTPSQWILLATNLAGLALLIPVLTSHIFHIPHITASTEDALLIAGMLIISMPGFLLWLKSEHESHSIR